MIVNPTHAKMEQLVLMVLLHTLVLVSKDTSEKIAKLMRIIVTQIHVTMEAPAQMELIPLPVIVQRVGPEILVTRVSIHQSIKVSPFMNLGRIIISNYL